MVVVVLRVPLLIILMTMRLDTSQYHLPSTTSLVRPCRNDVDLMAAILSGSDPRQSSLACWSHGGGVFGSSQKLPGGYGGHAGSTGYLAGPWQPG